MTHPSWHAALRDLKSDRQTREPIRQERLRSRMSALCFDSKPLCAWRGRSGRRYVVVIFTRTGLAAELTQMPSALSQAVILAVRNTPSQGTSSIVAASEGLEGPAAESWIASLARIGIDEFHVHRLAAAQADRQAILLDLTTPDLEATP